LTDDPVTPHLVPAFFVDALPEELWSAANLFQFFGQRLHFCVGGDGPRGVRTIELDGVEVAQGRMPFTDFVDGLSTEGELRRWQFDLGWLVIGALAMYLVAVVAGHRILSRRA
jgi:hypothetical protein